MHGGHSTLAPTDDLCLLPATAQADRLRGDNRRGGIWSLYLWRGCGVTAHDQDEALDLIREMTRQLPGSEAEPLPAVRSIVADVDVSNLPEYARTAGVPVWRGVWYPPETLRGPR